MNMYNIIRLSSVCRAWRLTACSSGHLWRTTYLTPFDTDLLHTIDTLTHADARLNLNVDNHFWSHIQDVSLDFHWKIFRFRVLGAL